MLDQLKLRNELLLLHLQVLQGRGGLGPVGLQQVGLLHKVDLELLLQLGDQALELLPAAISQLLLLLLDQLLEVGGVEAAERVLQELLHLLQARGEQGKLQGRAGLARLGAAGRKKARCF